MIRSNPTLLYEMKLELANMRRSLSDSVRVMGCWNLEENLYMLTYSHSAGRADRCAGNHISSFAQLREDALAR